MSPRWQCIQPVMGLTGNGTVFLPNRHRSDSVSHLTGQGWQVALVFWSSSSKPPGHSSPPPRQAQHWSTQDSRYAIHTGIHKINMMDDSLKNCMKDLESWLVKLRFYSECSSQYSWTMISSMMHFTIICHYFHWVMKKGRNSWFMEWIHKTYEFWGTKKLESLEIHS